MSGLVGGEGWMEEQRQARPRTMRDIGLGEGCTVYCRQDMDRRTLEWVSIHYEGCKTIKETE